MSRCKKLLEKLDNLFEKDATETALLNVISQFQKNQKTKVSDLKWKKDNKGYPYIIFTLDKSDPKMDVEISYAPSMFKQGMWAINVFIQNRNTAYSVYGEIIKSKEGSPFKLDMNKIIKAIDKDS